MKLKMVTAVLMTMVSPAWSAATANAEATFFYTLSPVDPNGVGPLITWSTMDEPMSAAVATISINFSDYSDSNRLGLNEIGAAISVPDVVSSQTVLHGNSRNGDTSFQMYSIGYAHGWMNDDDGQEHPTGFSAILGGAGDFSMGPNTIMTWYVDYSLSSHHDGMARIIRGPSLDPSFVSESASSSLGLWFTTTDGQGLAFTVSDPAAGAFSVALRNETAEQLIGRVDFLVQSESVGLLPVPEPETYALMLLGLGAVALARRRRV